MSNPVPMPRPTPPQPQPPPRQPPCQPPPCQPPPCQPPPQRALAALGSAIVVPAMMSRAVAAIIDFRNVPRIFFLLPNRYPSPQPSSSCLGISALIRNYCSRLFNFDCPMVLRQMTCDQVPIDGVRK